MQAALPMYFPPHPAVQDFWAALAALLRADAACHKLEIPHALREASDVHAQWQAPDLLLSQACGYPLVTLLKDQVQLVGTFAYTAAGVDGIFCRSQLICRASDPRTTLAAFADSTLAFNDRISQSGYNALRALVASTTTQRPFFARTVDTGAHYRSIEAVRACQADMAAIDPVSWAHWQRANPVLSADLRVFGETESYPGLPLVTSLQTPPQVLAALRRTLHALATDTRHSAVRTPLLVTGFVATQLADYQRCLDMQDSAHGMALHHP